MNTKLAECFKVTTKSKLAARKDASFIIGSIKTTYDAGNAKTGTYSVLVENILVTEEFDNFSVTQKVSVSTVITVTVTQ